MTRIDLEVRVDRRICTPEYVRKSCKDEVDIAIQMSREGYCLGSVIDIDERAVSSNVVTCPGYISKFGYAVRSRKTRIQGLSP